MRKLLKRQGLLPTSIVTDRYRAYDAALRDLGLSRLHCRGKRLNNRAESSHVPIRTRAEDAGFSICRIRATFSRLPLSRLQHLQHLPPSDHSLDTSDPEGTCIRRVEDVRGRHRLTQYAVLPPS